MTRTMLSFLNGIAAGCAFVVVELLGRALQRVPTLPELVQDRLVLLLPGPAFAFLLDRLLYLGKPLLFSALVLTQVVIGGLAGVLIDRWGRPALVAAAGWLATGFVLLPLARRGVFAGSLAVAVVLLLASAAFALTFVLVARLPLAPRAWLRQRQHPTQAADATLGRQIDRRRALAGGGLSLAAVVLTRRTIGRVPALPRGNAITSGASDPALSPPSSDVTGATAAVPGLSPAVTPTDRFYVVSKNLFDPEIDTGEWRLRIDGLVSRPFTLRYADLLEMPAVTAYRTLECVSNAIGGDLISNGLWTGVRLADLLERAGVQSAAGALFFTSGDGYTADMPLAQALDPATLLAYQLNGQPLPVKHGSPVRVLGTGTYGMKNPKWLTRIEAVAQPRAGFWQEQGWDEQGIVQTMTRIDTPATGARLGSGPATVGGIAFAADRGIGRVEVSTDGGATWGEARLLPSLGAHTWTLWQYGWQRPTPGASTIMARATDGAGVPQTARETDPFPAGATGYHRIRLRVKG